MTAPANIFMKNGKVRSGTVYLKKSSLLVGIFMVTDNLTAAALEFPRPRLAVSPPDETSLRPSKKQKIPRRRDVSVFFDPTGNRTRVPCLKSKCPNR